MCPEQHNPNVTKRLRISTRRVLLAVLCTAAVAIVPAASVEAGTAAGADVVLLDISSERAAVGTPYTYAYEVINWGPDSATAVDFAAVLHGAASFESASSTQGACTFTPATDTVGCSVGGLTSGSSATVEIVVMPADGMSSDASVTSAAGEDPDLANNAATSSPEVLPSDSADLWVYANSGVDDTGFGSAGYVIPGDPYDYSIDVINYGPAAARGVLLSVLLPFGVEFQEADAECTVFADDGLSTLVTCRLGRIETARTVLLTAVTPVGAAGRTLRTEVIVDGSGADPGPQPNGSANYLVVGPGLSAENETGSEGGLAIEIPLELFGSVDRAISVDYATSDGTAHAGTDYEATAGTVTFAPGQKRQSVSVPLLSDSQTEADETFTLTLSNVNDDAVAAAAGGPPVTVVKPEATATIRDNDPKVRVRDIRAREGDGGTKPTRFIVKLSHSSPETLTVQFRTADGSARARSDYVPVRRTIVFLPGQVKQAVAVAVRGDLKREPRERFFGKLSNVHGGLLADAKGTARILDND